MSLFPIGTLFDYRRLDLGLWLLVASNKDLNFTITVKLPKANSQWPKASLKS